jgi:hypothetical protein
MSHSARRDARCCVSLSSATLTGVMRAVTGCPRLRLISAQTTVLHHAHEATVGVYRIAGSGDDAGMTVSWSVALKIVHAAQMREPLREVAAYRSGLLADLPGIRAPHCYGIEEHNDGAIWLWLEDIVASEDWPVARFALAARHFGHFNGAYLVERPLPNAPWLSRDLLRTLVAQRYPATLRRIQQPQTWTRPLVRQMFPTPIAPHLLELWAAHERLLAAIERLPRTFCHHDSWQLNLFVRSLANGGEETIAIDWALAGIGALGEELGQFVAGSLMLDEVPDDVALRLPNAAWEGYLAGLADSGWRGDERQVRLAYLVSATLRWGLAPPGLSLALDESRHALVEQRRGQPIARILAHRARATYILLDLAEEALGLVERDPAGSRD